jgi:hypothetical protein
MQMNLTRGVQLSCTSQAQLNEGLLAAAGQGSRPASPPARGGAGGRGMVASTGTGVEDREPEPEPVAPSGSSDRRLNKKQKQLEDLDEAVCCQGKCGACHKRPCQKTRDNKITCWKVFRHHHVPRSLETLREQRAELLTAREILMHGEMEVIKRLLAIVDPDKFSSKRLFGILHPARPLPNTEINDWGGSRSIPLGMLARIDRQKRGTPEYQDIHAGDDRRPGFTTISRISKELEEVEHRIAFIEGIHTKIWVGMLTLAYAIAQYYIMKKINDLEDGGSGEF